MQYQSSYLFVYGYLMSQNRVKTELKVPHMPVKYAGQGFIHGQLFLIESFPGMTYDLSLKKRTYGEIYLLKEQAHFFKQMDEYELSLPNYTQDPYYKRVVRPVHRRGGRAIPCWVYEYIKPTGELEELKTGRFLLSSSV